MKNNCWDQNKSDIWLEHKEQIVVRVMKWIFLLKESWRKKKKFHLPFVKRKQVFQDCLLQSNKSFGIFGFT